MNKSKIQVGVIGLGVGEAHIKSYRKTQNVEVKSICDFDSARLEEIGNRYNIDNRYTHYKNIVEDPDISVVSICSFDNCH
jgi:predicted dehydrogenase